jgi:hypothetical protein
MFSIDTTFDLVPSAVRQSISAATDLSVIGSAPVDGSNPNTINTSSGGAGSPFTSAPSLGSGSLSGDATAGSGLGTVTVYTVPAGKTLTTYQIQVFAVINTGGTSSTFSIESPSGTVIASGTISNATSPYLLNGPFSTIPAGQAVIFRVPGQGAYGPTSMSATANLHGTIA